MITMWRPRRGDCRSHLAMFSPHDATRMDGGIKLRMGAVSGGSKWKGGTSESGQPLTRGAQTPPHQLSERRGLRTSLCAAMPRRPHHWTRSASPCHGWEDPTGRRPPRSSSTASPCQIWTPPSNPCCSSSGAVSGARLHLAGDLGSCLALRGDRKNAGDVARKGHTPGDAQPCHHKIQPPSIALWDGHVGVAQCSLYVAAWNGPTGFEDLAPSSNKASAAPASEQCDCKTTGGGRRVRLVGGILRAGLRPR